MTSICSVGEFLRASLDAQRKGVSWVGAQGISRS